MNTRHLMADIKPLSRANAGLAINVADALKLLDVPGLPPAAEQILHDLIDRSDDVGSGVPVSVAARLLDVSDRTVRDWVRRGVLDAVEGSQPVAIRSRSLGEALNAAGLIRSHVSRDARLLRYLGERDEFDGLRSRLQEFDNRVVLEESRVEEQLFTRS